MNTATFWTRTAVKPVNASILAKTFIVTRTKNASTDTVVRFVEYLNIFKQHTRNVCALSKSVLVYDHLQKSFIKSLRHTLYMYELYCRFTDDFCLVTIPVIATQYVREKKLHAN